MPEKKPTPPAAEGAGTEPLQTGADPSLTVGVKHDESDIVPMPETETGMGDLSQTGVDPSLTIGTRHDEQSPTGAEGADPTAVQPGANPPDAQPAADQDLDPDKQREIEEARVAAEVAAQHALKAQQDADDAERAAAQAEMEPNERACPNCHGPMTRHTGDNPEKGRAWHCDRCGGCFVHVGSTWRLRDGHPAPRGWSGA